MNSNYLPSKRIFYLIGVILLIAVVAVISNSDFSGSENQSLTVRTESGDAVTRSSDDDSDSDGLNDWEELLWETDPNNPDSDGDGTEDGEEVSQNRHPAIPGERFDSLTEAQIRAVERSQPETQINVTESVFDNFLPRAVLLANEQYQGNTISQSQYEDLAEVIRNEITLPEDGTDYTRSELTVSSNSSPEAVDEYFENLRAVIQSYEDTPLGEELGILGQAIPNNRASQLVGLRYISMTYRALNTELLELAVPANMAELHLRLINNYEDLATSVSEMRYIQSDPLRTTRAVSNYREHSRQIEQTMGLIIQTVSSET